MTDQMEQVEQVADVLKNWRKYSSPESTRGRSHSGLKHIMGHEEVAAKRVLQRNWNGRMVVSSMFKMAQYVESALDLKLKWLERYHLARLLMSSLTFAGIYKCVQENSEDSFSPYVIHSLVGHEPPKDRPSFKTRIGKPFPKWTKNVDRWGNVLVKSANNVPPEFEYSPEVFDQPKYHHPFLEAVHKLERIPFRINEELLDLVIELDKNPDTRIIHGEPPDDVLEERQQKLAELYDQYDMDTVNAKWQAHPSKKIKEIILFGSDDEEIKFSYDDGYEKYSHKKTFEGIINNLERRYLETDSDWKREEISQYQSDTKCERCNGQRLKEEALCVKIVDLNISEVSEKSIYDASKWFSSLEEKLDQRQLKIAEHILKEIIVRLDFLLNVGLEYLTLSRESGTLSGGESQRIRLASQIGSGLTGVLYVLDEPSIGLHQKDNIKLINALNSVITPLRCSCIFSGVNLNSLTNLSILLIYNTGRTRSSSDCRVTVSV